MSGIVSSRVLTSDGGVKLAEDVLRFLLGFLIAQVPRFQSDPFFQFLHQAFRKGVPDALDFGVNLAKLGIGGRLRLGQGFDLRFQMGVFLGDGQDAPGPETVVGISGEEDVIDETVAG